MSEEANPQTAVVPSPATETTAVPDTVAHLEVKADANEAVASGAPAPEASREPKEVAMPTLNDAPAPAEPTSQEEANDKQITSSNVTQDNPALPREDVEMADSTKLDDTVPTADGSAESTNDTPASAGKEKPRRKSGGIPEHKGKKLNKKASKAKMTHSDAKPGDYFYVRLKGYPLWPAIVCDESMLPNTLIKSRPVTAARPDGSYRADFEDGGPKVKDRSFPVMYLYTNEFGWIPNKDLVDLDFDEVGNVSANTRKDLAAAHQLAAEQHDLEYFKEILKNFMEAREAERAAKEAAKAEKKAKKAAAKKEKKPPKIVEDGDDEDIDMADAPGEVDSEAPGMTEVEVVKTSKKRKSSATADDRDSVKKPRPNIKLTTTPKATNGTSTPKSTKEHSTTKSTKHKTKKSTTKAPETPEVVAPKEPEMTAEEKRAKKEKEILFLRHKLQKGLLTRDQDPKEEEMKQMSEYVLKLEGYADLEVSIIRATKINKVLKAILKLNTIPKEEDFRFKPRSQTLLDKWNKLLANEQGTPVAAPAVTNGAATETRTEVEESKASPAEPTNGSKESPTEEKVEEKVQEDAPAAKSAVPETKNMPGAVETAPAPSVDETSKESIPPPAPVETSA
ncbi:hypothetical protein NA56DRAFT_473079 [Hyaloscypha hepaticicola]|uniref:PWWP domain-containing protein n=1 Tax=Hyaloscypha hepaticicola TaxID=2082293 RepID=A0A2J6QFY4_9HELO|nr:hypothetical protein NA56DRAFT_473079 [Hyaloscypha hepaticicola]